MTNKIYPAIDEILVVGSYLRKEMTDIEITEANRKIELID